MEMMLISSVHVCLCVRVRVRVHVRVRVRVCVCVCVCDVITLDVKLQQMKPLYSSQGACKLTYGSVPSTILTPECLP